jgi:hypothetical protein
MQLVRKEEWGSATASLEERTGEVRVLTMGRHASHIHLREQSAANAGRHAVQLAN